MSLKFVFQYDPMRQYPAKNTPTDGCGEKSGHCSTVCGYVVLYHSRAY